MAVVDSSAVYKTAVATAHQALLSQPLVHRKAVLVTLFLDAIAAMGEARPPGTTDRSMLQSLVSTRVRSAISRGETAASIIGGLVAISDELTSSPPN